MLRMKGPAGSELSGDGAVVVVGCSIAGLRAAEELRRLGFAGQLTLVGAERHFPPFDRPPLSKEVLSAKWELEQARLRLFGDLNATMILGRQAVGLDMATRQVELDDGERIGYEGLVIATGASVRRIRCPGSDLAGIHYFRTAEDCSRIRQSLTSGPRVVVIGGGFIGSEVAAACRGHGLQVTVVDLVGLPMAEQLGDPLARYVIDQHRDHGSALRLGVGVAAFAGADKVERVLLSDGTAVDADVVVVGVGVVPETTWLAGAGLVLDDGVVCDANCVPLGAANIVAAGDVASWFNPVYGTTMRVEHWTNAVQQAEYAAGALLGATGCRDGYASVPYFWSNQYDMHLQVAGVRGSYEVIAEGSLAERKFIMISRESGRDVGVLGVNWPAKFQRYRRQLTEQLAVVAR
jgi:3-phenylpropionate/trans-cinnamate dioxygenase ferredoxin reductase component